VAVLTPAGRGAIASLVVDGSIEQVDWDRLFSAANQRPLAEQAVGRICLGHWGDGQDGLPTEQIVVCRIGFERIELHCHGGSAAVDRILQDLADAGVIRCEWTELIETKDGTGGKPARRFEIEVAKGLAAATTWRTAEVLLDQQAGVLGQALHRLETVGWGQGEQAEAMLGELLEWSELGRQLEKPPTVALVGAPNVGKSSLLNALLGFGRAIVWDEPGTTRDVISGHTALEGWPLRLVDTAGLRETDDEIEAVGVEYARRELDAADLVVLVVDRSQVVDDGCRSLMNELGGGLGGGLVVANKSDLPDATGGALPQRALAVSALTREGVDRLASAILGRLVPAVPEPGTAVPVSARMVECLEAARRAIAASDEEGFREAVAGAIG
jgi:tRNA modification GTPase